MNITNTTQRLPSISIKMSVLLASALIVASLAAVALTPKLVEVTEAPDLAQTVPTQIGDWKELPSPYVQVSLSTGPEDSWNRPYDQTVMRTYVNSKGEQIMLALAWGKRQRQEAKVHRPDLCYVAQGYPVKSLVPQQFQVDPSLPQAVTGKHMVVMSSRGGEAVSYWIRIGTLYSENAFETRMHIFKEGLQGRVPDGILVRASQRISSTETAKDSFPILDEFLKELVAASPDSTKALLIR